MLRTRDALLSPAELAAELDVTTETLRRWRKAGTGPAWFRLGDRFVRYQRDDIRTWLVERGAR